MYLLYSVNVYIFNVVIEIKFYSILFYSIMSPPPYSGGDICGKTPAFRSKTSRVAKRDDFHSKLLFFVKKKKKDNETQTAVQK